LLKKGFSEGTATSLPSMTAPIASGWSDCRVGFSPTGKRRLCTAHAKSDLGDQMFKVRSSVDCVAKLLLRRLANRDSVGEEVISGSSA